MLDSRTAAVAAAMMLVAFDMGAAHAKSRPDDLLYTLYLTPPSGQEISFDVCGKLVNAQGCFGGADISPPFEQACAVVEDPPVYKKNRVTRMIYILDRRYSSSDQMLLYIYSRKDTITANTDTVDVEYQRRIFLGITGGSKSQCHMANGPNFLYAGTNKSSSAVQLDKVNFTLANVGGPDIVSITADDRGYVDVNYGDGQFAYAPDGTGVDESSGKSDFVGTTNAWVPQY